MPPDAGGYTSRPPHYPYPVMNSSQDGNIIILVSKSAAAVLTGIITANYDV